MKNYKYPIFGLLFLIIAIPLIKIYGPFLSFFPSQEVVINNGPSYQPVPGGTLNLQEITMKKRYLSRIDLFLAKLPSEFVNDNVFLLMNQEYKILFSKKFTSKEIDGPNYYAFKLNKTLDIGKGNKVFVCIYSVNGDESNYIAFPWKTNPGLDSCFSLPIQNNDVLLTLQNLSQATSMGGTMGFKTYESGTAAFSFLQCFLYILALLVSLIIIFFEKIIPVVLRVNLSPAFTFLTISLLLGSFMVFVTPPFQIPDEPSHFYRIYEISEANIFKYHDSIPKSLTRLAAISDRMKFNTNEKIVPKEIKALSDIRLDPAVKTNEYSPDYVVPYLPAVLGLMIGKILNLSPLWLFYLGRIFNLLASILILFLAIKKTPVLKWVFFLLSLMPMTVYQMASLSYDAMTLSLALLLIALILDYALNPSGMIRHRDIMILFIVAILLAFCKPPYFIIAFSFLIIPVKKIGTWKKYIVIFLALLISVFIAFQFWSQTRELFMPVKKTVVTLVASLAPPDPVTIAQEQQQQQNTQDQPATAQVQEPPTLTAPAVNPFDPEGQKKFILKNPFTYLLIILDSVLSFIGFYMIAFVGLFGWVDTPLPLLLIYLYIFVLFIASFFNPPPEYKVGLFKRIILFLVFFASLVLIETAMYLYCNPVGSSKITAVQGRYLIAIAPLFFILFYNQVISRRINNGFFQTKAKNSKEKKVNKKKPVADIIEQPGIVSKLYPWLLTIFTLFILLYSLFVIINRFYIIVI